MTKKAAKKKSATRKKSTKAAASPTAKKDGDAAPKDPGEAAGEIAVIEEKAPAEGAEKSPRGGRVPRQEGSKKPDSARQRSGASRRGGGRRGGGARPEVDSEELSKKAWKVFQQEIAEEGLALIDENAARQLAEKSIVITRAFLEERERRLGKGKPGSDKKDRKSGEETPEIDHEAPAGEDT